MRIVSTRHGKITATLLVLVLFFGLILLICSGGVLAQTRPSPSPELLAEQVKALASQAEALKTLLSLFLGLSTLYGLAAAVTAFVNVNQSLKSFEAQFADMKQSFQAQFAILEKQTKAQQDQLRSEIDIIRADVPALRTMRATIADLLARLEAELHLEETDWTGASVYADLTEPQRQAFFLAELTVSGFEFFQLQRLENLRRPLSQVYQHLACFYAARAIGKVEPDLSWIRAEFYFRKAREADGKDAKAFRNAAVLQFHRDSRRATSEPEQSEVRERAIRAFLGVLEMDKNEPGALFGIATMYLFQSNYGRAVIYLDTLVNDTELSRRERDKYLPSAWLQKACVRIRETGPASPPADQLEALTFLEKGHKEIKRIHRTDYSRTWDVDIRREFAPGGDLVLLWTNYHDRCRALFMA